MSTFQADALTWLTAVRGNHAVVGSRQERQELFFGDAQSTNRWISSSAREEIGVPVEDTMVAAESENVELGRERLRRRAMPLKSLLLRSAPPPSFSVAQQPPSQQSMGFDAIDTSCFAYKQGSMFGNRHSKAVASSSSAAGVRKNTAGAQQALAAVQNQSELSAAQTQRAAAAVGTVSFSSDGACSCTGMRNVGAVDQLVKQITSTKRADSAVIHSLDVSQSGAFQDFSETEGPLMRRIVPLTYLREQTMPWVAIRVLIADGCQLHDFDAEFIARALRDSSNALERVSLRNNQITGDGADRLKKAVKYNSRICEINLAGNPCTQRRDDKSRQILATLDDRLAQNRRKLGRQ